MLRQPSGLQMNEPALLNTCHSVQVSRILKWRVARTYQADMLLKVCIITCLTDPNDRALSAVSLHASAHGLVLLLLQP